MSIHSRMPPVICVMGKEHYKSRRDMMTIMTCCRHI